MLPPVVAILGSTGYVGKCLMPAFLEAVQDERLKELRVLTSEAKLKSEQIQAYIKSGAKTFVIDYKEPGTIVTALDGVDVAVSAIGMEPNFEEINIVLTTLLDALVATNVKAYFPSEFSLSYDKVSRQNQEHPAFAMKIEHFLESKRRGLKTIRFLPGVIMEWFGLDRWMGLDVTSGVWTVVGNGPDDVWGMTAKQDLGRFALEAILLAHSDPSKCPDEIEVYGEVRPLREYAKAFEDASGKKYSLK